MPDLPDVPCLDWALHRPHAAHDWTSAGFGDAHCAGYGAARERAEAALDKANCEAGQLALRTIMAISGILRAHENDPLAQQIKAVIDASIEHGDPNHGHGDDDA